MAKKKIFIAGHKGMVGSSLIRLLENNKYDREVLTASKEELDLLNQNQVNEYFKKNKLDEVIIAAAKVGGIYANATYPANFIYENLTIANNIIHAAYQSKTSKLLFLGSSCIYPRNCKQPINENFLISGQEHSLFIGTIPSGLLFLRT